MNEQWLSDRKNMIRQDVDETHSENLLHTRIHQLEDRPLGQHH